MAEENVQIAQTPAPVQEPQPAPTNNLDSFASSVWGDEEPTPAQPEPTPATPEPQPATPEPVAAAPEIIDANEYLKQQLGYDDWTKAKEEIEQLRKLREQAQTPAEIKFANDEAKRYYEAITGGKSDDVYKILHQQKQIERLEKLGIANTNEAIDIIKASYQFKHPDLSPDEVDFLISNKYSKPTKPEQGAEEDDAVYEMRVNQWQQQVQNIDKQMVIDAKLAKPDLLKYKSELVLPDIPKPEQSTEPSPESLEKAKADYERFLSQLNNGYQNFKGFESKVKDESGELPVTFNVPDEERAAIYEQLKDFNLMEFFDGRWFDKDGNANVNQMMSDLYLLQKSEKVFQGMNTNAANKKMENYLKLQNNIKVNGATTPQQAVVPNNQQLMDELANAAFQL